MIKEKKLMTIDEKHNKAIQKIADRITDNIFSTKMMNEINKTGHADIKHGKRYQSTENQLERLLNPYEKTKAVSATNDETLIIERAILDHDMEIAKWLHDDNKREHTLELITIDDTEILGEGVMQNAYMIQQRKARQATVILQKSDNEYGFSVITAYPNILLPSASPTYHDIRPELHNTNVYKNASNEQRQIWNQKVLNGLKRDGTTQKTKLSEKKLPRLPDGIDPETLELKITNDEQDYYKHI